MRERPDSGSSAQEVADFYLEQDRGVVALVGLYIIPFAGIAFLWFVAAIRSHLGAQEDRFFATVMLGSGILFVATLFAASAAAGSLVAGVKFLDQPPLSPDAVLFARALGFSLLFVFGVRMAAVFMLVTSTIGLRTGFLPRWLVVVGYVCGLVFLLTATYIEVLALLLPAWVAAVSVEILRAARRLERHASCRGDDGLVADSVTPRTYARASWTWGGRSFVRTTYGGPCDTLVLLATPALSLKCRTRGSVKFTRMNRRTCVAAGRSGRHADQRWAQGPKERTRRHTRCSYAET